MTNYTLSAEQKQILDIVKHSKTKNPLEFTRDAVKQLSLDYLNTAISNCDCCNAACKTRTLGTGNIHGSVMIIGDYAAEEQQRASKPIDFFEDNEKNKNILDYVFTKLNINTDELFFMNCVNCSPAQEVEGRLIYRCPNSKEIDACSTFIKYAVDIMHPAMIILLGNVALNCFKKESMTKAHGSWVNAYTIPAMPIYSPNYIRELKKNKMDNASISKLTKEMFDDFKNAFLYLQNKFPNNNVIKKTII